MSKEQLLTSTNEVPKHKNALEEKYKEQKPSRYFLFAYWFFNRCNFRYVFIGLMLNHLG